MTLDTDLATLRDGYAMYQGKPRHMDYSEQYAALDRVEAEINYLRHNDHVLRAEAAEAELARLREGLRWYADDANYRLTPQDAARGRNAPVVDDDGHRARALLAEDGAATITVTPDESLKAYGSETGEE